MKKVKEKLVKIHYSKLMVSLRKPIVKGFWIFSLLLSIQSFTYKLPYFIVLGIMLLLISILTNPWLNKILSIFNIKLTLKQKWFIGLSNFLTAAYSVKPSEKEFYRVIISALIMIMFWIVTIIYSKKKK